MGTEYDTDHPEGRVRAFVSDIKTVLAVSETNAHRLRLIGQLAGYDPDGDCNEVDAVRALVETTKRANERILELEREEAAATAREYEIATRLEATEREAEKATDLATDLHGFLVTIAMALDLRRETSEETPQRKISEAIVEEIGALRRDRVELSRLRGDGVVALGLEESDRQLVLMALACLAGERPGFDDALSAIAAKIDNPTPDGPELYGRFKALGGGAIVALRSAAERFFEASSFSLYEPGHPGYAAFRSGWVRREKAEEWERAKQGLGDALRGLGEALSGSPTTTTIFAGFVSPAYAAAVETRARMAREDLPASVVVTDAEDRALHPNGRCTCAGEGRCAWCLEHGSPDVVESSPREQRYMAWMKAAILPETAAALDRQIASFRGAALTFLAEADAELTPEETPPKESPELRAVTIAAGRMRDLVTEAARRAYARLGVTDVG